MTIYGWDVSHFDGPDTRGAVGQGIQFMTHKAGGDANDAEVAPWWNLMRPYRDRLLLGAYWVLYPGTPATRADAFVARLDDTCPGWRDGPFMLQVDCEIWAGNTGTLPGRADVRAFCDRLRQRAPKLMPIVYGPKWCYGDALTGVGYPLWASNYVAGSGSPAALYPGDGSSRWGAYSGQVPAVLQFTSSAVIGGQTTCDANAFRGTLAELTALLAPGWIEEFDMAIEIADLVRSPWQYTGGGIPTGMSTLGVLNEIVLNTRDLRTALEAARIAEVQRDAAESAAIAGLITLVKTLTTTGGGADITDAQLDNLISRVKTAAGDAAAAAVGPLEQEIQSLREHLGDDGPTPARAAASPVDPSDTDPDIYTRTMREQAQQRITPPTAV